MVLFIGGPDVTVHHTSCKQPALTDGHLVISSLLVLQIRLQYKTLSITQFRGEQYKLLEDSGPKGKAFSIIYSISVVPFSGYFKLVFFCHLFRSFENTVWIRNAYKLS